MTGRYDEATDLTKARLFYSDGRVESYDSDATAYLVWLSMPRGVRIAFRGKGDDTPVYSWDKVDKG